MVVPSVFWDTNLFIYLIEERPRELHESVVRAREQMVSRGDELVTSALTLGEIMVQPIRAGKAEMAQRYADLISAGAVIVALDAAAARKYGEIRARFQSVKPPDAVQLACAASHGVSLFLTNDRRLERVRVAGVEKVAALTDWAA